MKKNICVVTGSRAEYGLLLPLLEKLKSQRQFNLKIIAAGMHLSPEFGLTYKEIERDGFKISEKVEMLLSSDTEVGISKSIGLGIIGFAEALKRIKPDLLILVGDRFEALACAIASYVARIPLAHLHGGELSQGAMDDAFRHAITKMSCLHFTSTESYRRRVIQLGEFPQRVFNVGALALDNIKGLRLLDKEELEKKLNFKFGKKNALLILHPVTLENNTAETQLKQLLRALDASRDLKIIFIKPNADTHGRVIIRLIDEYVLSNPDKARGFVSMSKLLYFSTLKIVDVLIGNSSSGIIEAPSFNKPTVNIGDRQLGRVRAGSIIDCQPETESISRAIRKSLTQNFQKKCQEVANPYAGAFSAEKIVRIIKRNIGCFKNFKKKFYDLKRINV